MKRRWHRGIVRAGLRLCPFVVLTVSAIAQSGAPHGEWRTYGGDLGNTRDAALDQITRENFSQLEVAWRFRTDSLGPRPVIEQINAPRATCGEVHGLCIHEGHLYYGDAGIDGSGKPTDSVNGGYVVRIDNTSGS